MYAVDGVLPVESVPDGSNLLVAGPPMTGKYDLVVSLLADGLSREEAALVVSTRHDADRVRSDVVGEADDGTDALVGVVDCVTRQQGGEPSDDPAVRCVSSPGDFTGAGMESSQLLEGFVERGLRTRVALHSISQLLMYADVKTVFRFLHVFTGRIATADALGLGVLDTEAHDDETEHTIRQLFDGLVQTRNRDGTRELRVRALGDGTGEWTAF